MEYAELVDVYERLAATSATLEKTDVLAEAFEAADRQHLSMLVTLVRGRVFANWESRELGVSTSLASDAIEKATGVPGEDIETWWREEGDLGDAAAKAVEAKTQQTLFAEPLTVRKVHDTLQELAEYEGSGSQERRVDALAGLLSSADPREARYVVRTVVGTMRLGVGEGLIRDAIAGAFLGGDDEAVRAVERAYEVTNDFPLVAERAVSGGRAALDDLDLEVFRPIKPMLARKAESTADAVAELGAEGDAGDRGGDDGDEDDGDEDDGDDDGDSDGDDDDGDSNDGHGGDSNDGDEDDGEVLVETKYDGIRAKLHRDGDDVRLFTRRLENVTRQFPDVVEAVSEAVAAERYILETEVVGYDPATGDPVPFQELSQRIKRKYDIEAMAEEIPVTVYVFDCLLLDEESLLEQSLAARLDALEAVFTPLPDRIERAHHVGTADAGDAAAFYEDAVAAGHEGVMVKNLEAPYRPGSRVGYQLKVKTTMEPLDLVVTRAKWSEGRKSDFLGRPYLACRDESDGSLREVGRMHTGFTDAQLEEFTDLVEPLIQEIDGREASLRPEIVLEVEYEEIQRSPKYDSGYALRFPRLSRIRTDLGPVDADAFSRVESLYEDQG